MRDAAKFIALTRVRPGREQEFEGLIPALVAAQEQARPDLDDQWQLLRPDGEAPAFLFLFYGDASIEEWDIERLCVEALGDEEGRRLAERILDCLDGEQDVYAFSGAIGTP